MYKQLKKMNGDIADCILNTDTGSVIPFDEENTDYQAYLKWLSEGNEPLPAEEQ